MRIVADENIDQPLVAWLREQGHEVFWVAEQAPGITDEAVIAEARQTGGVLLTADLDFGEHVFQQGNVTSGVVLLRLRTSSMEELADRFTRAWRQVQGRIPGCFVVVSNDKLRIRPLPDTSDD